MSDLEQRVAALRAEMDGLKAALQTATDEAERCELHMRLNDCIRASMRLIDERIQACTAYLQDKQRRTAAEHETLYERSVGEAPRTYS